MASHHFIIVMSAKDLQTSFPFIFIFSHLHGLIRQYRNLHNTGVKDMCTIRRGKSILWKQSGVWPLADTF